jgi:hypothetical protein
LISVKHDVMYGQRVRVDVYEAPGGPRLGEQRRRPKPIHRTEPEAIAEPPVASLYAAPPRDPTFADEESEPLEWYWERGFDPPVPLLLEALEWYEERGETPPPQLLEELARALEDAPAAPWENQLRSAFGTSPGERVRLWFVPASPLKQQLVAKVKGLMAS